MGVHLALQPKHRHLSNQLRQRLIVENRAPGDRFMTVREIAKAYSVSLVTAHQSVQEPLAITVIAPVSSSRANRDFASAESLSEHRQPWSRKRLRSAMAMAEKVRLHRVGAPARVHTCCPKW